MNTRSSLRGLGVFAIVLMAAFAAFPAGARDGGHGGGGSHAGAFRGGGRAGYGLHGGYGYRGGWRGYGYYGGWGWGGLGYGLFFGALPFYYSTLWWDGVPYYYAHGDYYMWNGAVGEYETVPPPPELESQAAAQQPSVTNYSPILRTVRVPNSRRAIDTSAIIGPQIRLGSIRRSPVVSPPRIRQSPAPLRLHSPRLRRQRSVRTT